jgi:hypothetical protein
MKWYEAMHQILIIQIYLIQIFRQILIYISYAYNATLSANLSKRILLFPHLENKHWILIVANPSELTITQFGGLQQFIKKAVTLVSLFLQNFQATQNQTPSVWTEIQLKTPAQNNCGPWVVESMKR